MKTAWYEAGLSFLFLAYGAWKVNWFFVLVALVEAWGCWEDQQRAFKEEDDGRDKAR